MFFGRYDGDNKDEREFTKNLAAVLQEQQRLAAKIGALVEERGRAEQKEMITLSATYTHSANGYKYNTLYASDSLANTPIVVGINGVEYTYVLRSGANEVNLPDGAYIVSLPQSSPMLLIRHNNKREQQQTPEGRVIGAFTGSANQTYNFPQYVRGFAISNNAAAGGASLSFTIGGQTISVQAGQSFSDYFQPFNSVVIASTVSYSAYGLL